MKNITDAKTEIDQYEPPNKCDYYFGFIPFVASTYGFQFWKGHWKICEENGPGVGNMTLFRAVY